MLHSEREAKQYSANKLITDLFEKKKYVVHYRNLQTYIQIGAVLTYIHHGIKFTQKSYLKPFIDGCTEKRISFKDPLKKCYGN